MKQFLGRDFGTALALSRGMRTVTVISMTAAALLFVGCNSNGVGSPNASTASSGTSTIVTQDCLPLTQLIAFSGSATIGESSAVADGGNQGQLGLDIVSGVLNVGGSTSYSGSGSDGVIQLTAQGSGSPSAVQGYVQISSAAWNQALSQLGGVEGQCLQSMTFDLEVSDQTLFGGQVVLTVSGTQIVLAF